MEHLQLIITRIQQETANSKSYFVQDVSGQKINYQSGQFLTIIVNFYGKEVRRSYSICSTDGVDEAVFFTIKRIENGEVSRYLLDTLQTGDIITSLPPTGRFTIDTFEANPSVFIAAGSGIAPVYSLIKKLLYQKDLPRILLIYQNRNQDEAMFRKELVSLQEKFLSRFVLYEIFSQPHGHLPHRRLNNNLLEKILLHYGLPNDRAKFYMCGPDDFMRMIGFTLKVMGVADEMIRKENFYAIPPPPPFIADTTPHNVVIHYQHKTHYLKVAYPQTLLDAALKHHIQLPYSCRGGA